MASQFRSQFFVFISFLALQTVHAADISGATIRCLSEESAHRKKEIKQKKTLKRTNELTDTAKKKLPVLIKEISTKIENKARKGQREFSINFSEYHSFGTFISRLGEKNVVLDHEDHKEYNTLLGGMLVGHFNKILGSDYNVSWEFKHASPYADDINVFDALLIITPKD